jgi:hypothetical protein
VGRIFYYTFPGSSIPMAHALKKTILSALESNDLDSIAAMTMDDRTVVTRLVRFAYDKETLIGWRAIKALGLVARSLVMSDHEFLRNACRKLLWSISDESGGIGWAAPEILGEIVSADTGRFADIVPLIAQVYDIEEDVFKAGVLYALFRVAEKSPELVAPYQDIISMSLADRDPLVRIRGIAIIGLLWSWARSNGAWSRNYCELSRLSLEKMTTDRGEAWVYKSGNFVSWMVGEEASTALKYVINSM